MGGPCGSPNEDRSSENVVSSSSSSGTLIEPSFVSKTEELEISPEKPSPISVLELLFSDDDISPASSVSRTVEAAIQPICIQFDKTVSCPEDQQIRITDSGDNEESAFEDESFHYSLAEEGFLHNHDECVKSQQKGMDMDEFLKIIGLYEDASCKSVLKFSPQPRKPKDENRDLFFDMEEVFEPLVKDRRYDGPLSPICGSPISPRQPYPYVMNMDYDDFSSFILTDSP